MGAKAQVFGIDEIPLGARVIVGPHSAPPTTLKKISKIANLADTSCKDVLKVLDVAKLFFKQGYRVVFVGVNDHEEAEMIKTSIPGAFIVSEELDIDHLPKNEVLGLVSQSTQTLENFTRLAKSIEDSGRRVVLGMTVCKETQLRQKAAKVLAQQVDKMVVVGDKNSHNTKELTTTCRKYVDTYQVETATELQAEWFGDTDKVGVSAGASTPDFVVDSVVKRLQEIASAKVILGRNKRYVLAMNKFRWETNQVRTLLLDRTLAFIEFIMHLLKRNPTGIRSDR